MPDSFNAADIILAQAARLKDKTALIYSDKTILLWLALIAVGVICLWLSRRGNRVLTLLSSLLSAAPFIWPTIYLLRDTDASERADRLLAVWPVLLIFSLVVVILNVKRRRGVSLVLPFIIIGAIHGAFMSQQLWGSTYAIWPLFMILVAMTLVELSSFPKPRSSWNGCARKKWPITGVPLSTVVRACRCRCAFPCGWRQR